MSRNEKGYFKKYCTIHSTENDSKYVQLFDLILTTEKYNEDEIKAAFSDDRYVRNFAVAKKYLYDQVIKSLKAFQGEKTIQKKIDWLLDKSGILFQKELISECRQSLRQARKLAYETDSFTSILKIIDLEKKISGLFRYKGIYRRMKTLLDEERKILDILQNLNAYQVIYYHVFEIIKKNRTTRTKAEIKSLSKIMKNEIFQRIDKAKSHRAKITYCSTWTFYYDLTAQHEKGYPIAEELLQIWESRPAMIRESTGKYIASIQNFLNRCYRLNKMDAFWIGIEKLMRIRPTSMSIEVQLFETIHHFKLVYFSIVLQPEKFDEVICQIDLGLKKYGDLIKQNFYNLFCFNISNQLIKCGKFEDALVWVNRILNIEKQEIQQDLRHFNMIHHMVIHYELGNYELLEHLVRSTSRYYQKEKKLYQFESLILQFMRMALSHWNQYGFKQLYHDFLDQCNHLCEDPFERKVLEYFDFKVWLESKITRKRMIDLYLMEHPKQS